MQKTRAMWPGSFHASLLPVGALDGVIVVRRARQRGAQVRKLRREEGIADVGAVGVLEAARRCVGRATADGGVDAADSAQHPHGYAQLDVDDIVDGTAA